MFVPLKFPWHACAVALAVGVAAGLGVGATGCESNSNSTSKPAMQASTGPHPQPSAPAPGPTTPAERILALGDSYTIGEGVSHEHRWPIQLATRLNLATPDRFGPPTILARTGWTTGDLLAALQRQLEARVIVPPYDWVTLQIGVNNQYRGLALDEYIDELDTLIAHAIKLAGNRPRRVIVVSIPDYSLTPFVPAEHRGDVAADLFLFNRACRDVAKKAGVRYVDITVQSQRAGDGPEWLVTDGLHPSAKMYAAWVEAIAPELSPDAPASNAANAPGSR